MIDGIGSFNPFTITPPTGLADKKIENDHVEVGQHNLMRASHFITA